MKSPCTQYKHCTFLSPELVDFLKEKEGFSTRPYKDGIDYTIGYGHSLIDLDRDTMQISEAKAEILLKEDIKKVTKYIVTRFKNFIFLDQGKRDAIISLAFNWGANSFLQSKVCAYTRKKKYQAAAKEFLDIVKSNGKVMPGLVKRRREEAKIYECGWYPYKNYQ